MSDNLNSRSKHGPEPLFTARVQYYTTPERDAEFRKLAAAKSKRVSDVRRDMEITFLTSQGVEQAGS